MIALSTIAGMQAQLDKIQVSPGKLKTVCTMILQGQDDNCGIKIPLIPNLSFSYFYVWQSINICFVIVSTFVIRFLCIMNFG